MLNTTFGGDLDGQSNACVGNNGWVDLSTYSFGFDEAVKVLYVAAIDSVATLDAIIYPVVFCARHRIELFIKSELRKIGSIRKNLAVPDKEIAKTHDLKVLWDKLYDLYCRCDRRYEPLVGSCRETILHFHEVDPRGETFRYPYSVDGVKHLTEQSVIGLRRFMAAYQKVTATMSEIEFLSDFLYREYGTGTFTEALSRDDLRNIATDLPDRTEWSRKDGDFDGIRNTHLKRYGLSSRKYSEALAKIQSHREFSALIGLEKEIFHCSSEKLLTALTIRAGLNAFSGTKEGAVRSEYESKRREYFVFLEGLSDQELATLISLNELGGPDVFSEEFEPIFEDNLKRVIAHRGSQVGYILTKANLVEMVERSLKKLGQTTLLKKLGDLEHLKRRKDVTSCEVDDILSSFTARSG